jgi:hypothetical protein
VENHVQNIFGETKRRKKRAWLRKKSIKLLFVRRCDVVFDVISFNTILQSKSNKMSRFPHDAKVYVGDLGSNASKQEIEDSFGYYGPLRSVWVARNPPGFAFVEFEDAR